MAQPNITEASPETPAGPETFLSGKRRNYALGLLLTIFSFNFLDRQIVNILAEPIKNDLGLADWQLGMLTGLSFAIFYVTLAIPIARLSERADRVKIVSVCIIVWSFFTATCGLATNFASLLLSRIGVGIGEAGCTPASHSLISDYVPKSKRASALAFFSLGIPIGSLIGMTMGGILSDHYGWRTAFFAVGIPGILVGLLALATLPEPRRNRAGKIDRATAPKLADAMQELLSKKSFWWASLGTSLTTFVGFGQLSFYGSFYLRNHEAGLQLLGERVYNLIGLELGSMGFLGLALGLILGVFGGAGTFIGGYVADKFAPRDIRVYVYLPAFAAIAMIPPFVLAMLIPQTFFSILLIGFPTLLGSFWFGPVFAAVQGLVTPRSRATAAAVFLFLANLIGLGLGPLTVGALSDIFADSMGYAEGIRWSLIVLSFTGLLSFGAFMVASRTLAKEMTS